MLCVALDLAVLVLQQVGTAAVQDARPAAQQGRRVQAGVEAAAGGLDADEAH